ncbi:MAG: NUDIX domain-containing protein [Candidatus Omnitrophica bacterium]|nr:NUDIX domain-containing protein [Candidatus Omnitrophota bacterium]
MPNIINKHIEFSTPWFKLIKKTVTGMSGANTSEEYYSILPDDYVSILAVTRDLKVPLVRQYRPAIEDYSIELPSGHVDQNETPEQAIKRELLEETGYMALEIELLGTLSPDTGRKSNRLWCFFSSKIEKHAEVGDNEGIIPELYSLSGIRSLMDKGSFDHALNLAVFTLAELKGKISFTK